MNLTTKEADWESFNVYPLMTQWSILYGCLQMILTH